VGEGGIRLVTREPLAIGESVHLDLTLHKQVIKADARVIHVEQEQRYHVGFAFEHLTAEDRAKVRAFLAEQATRAQVRE
jgi:hypothetical protein